MELILHYMYVVAIKDTAAWKGDTPFEAAIRRNHIQAVDTILAKNSQHNFVGFYPSQVLAGLYLAARTCGATMINLLFRG